MSSILNNSSEKTQITLDFRQERTLPPCIFDNLTNLGGINCMCRFSFSSSIYCIVGFISNPTNTQTHNNQTSSQVDANQFGIGLSSIT